MKNSIIIIYLLFLSSFSFAQNAEQHYIDSLKTELKNSKEDTLKVETLNQLSFKTYHLNSNESFKYAMAAKNLATKLVWEKGIADAYANVALCYWVNSNYSKALDYTYKSLKIHEKANNKVGMCNANNSLGIIYVDDKKYNRALIHYKAALKLCLETKDKKMADVYMNNIGDVYLQQKKYHDALLYFQKALNLNQSKNDSTYTAFYLTNVGTAYNSLKQYSKGINYINQSVKIFKNNNSLYNGYNKFELGRSYYLMSIEKENQNKKQNLLNQSIAYFNESVIIFEKFDALNDLQLSYSFISKANKEKGNLKDALKYFEKSYAIRNSIFSDENKQKITDLESQREIDLRDKQIIIQNLKIKSDSRKVYFLIVITTAIAILLGLFLWLYLSKRKTSQQLQEVNKTISKINQHKDKFFSIIAHDLRGPFNGFLGLTELLTEDLDSMNREETQFATRTIMSSANNLNKLLENLLEWSRMEQGLIPFESTENLLLPLVEECIATVRDKAVIKNLTIITTVDSSTVFADTNILQAVIRNIISNAVKFTPKGGEITIQSKEDSDKVTLSVKDSGIGMSEKIVTNLFRLDVQTNRKGTENEPSTGLGLILCKEFIEKHGGSIWVESEENKGSTFYFTFPKKKNTTRKMGIDFNI